MPKAGKFKIDEIAEIKADYESLKMHMNQTTAVAHLAEKHRCGKATIARIVQNKGWYEGENMKRKFKWMEECLDSQYLMLRDKEDAKRRSINHLFQNTKIGDRFNVVEWSEGKGKVVQDVDGVVVGVYTHHIDIATKEQFTRIVVCRADIHSGHVELKRLDNKRKKVS